MDLVCFRDLDLDLDLEDLDLEDLDLDLDRERRVLVRECELISPSMVDFDLFSFAFRIRFGMM